MALTKEQEDLYKKTMDEAKRQLDGIDGEMEKELQKARMASSLHRRQSLA